METKKFDKWFNALVLGGLSATLLLISAIKIGETPSGLPLTLLLVSVLSFLKCLHGRPPAVTGR